MHPQLRKSTRTYISTTPTSTHTHIQKAQISNRTTSLLLSDWIIASNTHTSASTAPKYKLKSHKPKEMSTKKKKKLHIENFHSKLSLNFKSLNKHFPSDSFFCQCGIQNSPVRKFVKTMYYYYFKLWTLTLSRQNSICSVGRSCTTNANQCSVPFFWFCFIESE